MKLSSDVRELIHRYIVAAFTLLAFFLICCCFAACYLAMILNELPEE